jgi:putative copper export protein
VVDFEEPLREVALGIARFSAFAAHGLLCGTVIVLLLVFRPTFSTLTGETWERGRVRFSERIEGLIQASLIMSAVATGVALLVQATLVADLRREPIGMSSFEGVFETTFGKWNALRFPVLLTLAVLIVSRVRKWAVRGAGDGRNPPSYAWWGTWLLLAVVLLITSTFSGHSTVASPKWLAVANDITHMVSASVWFAGIIILSVALPDGWTGVDEKGRLKLLAGSVTRFSLVAMISIAIVAVTGTINSFLHVAAANDLIDTNYGRAVSGKILLFLGILALGGINHYFVRHRLERAVEEGTDTPARRLFRRTIAIELGVAVAVMGVTGVLTGLARTKKVAPQTSSVGVGAQEQAADHTHSGAEP